MVLGNEENFLENMDIITEKIGIHLLSCEIVDQSFYFKNDHFLPKKLNKPVFHKNLLNFYVQFLGTTFENPLLIDNMPHKNLFNPPFSAIFLRHSMGHTMMLITYSKPFFFIWNFFIHSKCEFINL
jgi:hypothetical protein